MGLDDELGVALGAEKDEEGNNEADQQRRRKRRPQGPLNHVLLNRNTKKCNNVVKYREGENEKEMVRVGEEIEGGRLSVEFEVFPKEDIASNPRPPI